MGWPVLSIFMEDQSGKAVSEEVKDEVLDTLQSYWINVHDSRETVCSWTDTGLVRKDNFLATMERKFPWLKLCEGCWKTKQLWINYFGKWKSQSTKASPGPTNKPGQHQEPKAGTLINISSDISDAPASSKCRREGDKDSQPSSPRCLEDCNLIGNCHRLQFPTVIATKLQSGSGLCSIGAQITVSTPELKSQAGNYITDARIVIPMLAIYY